MWNKGNRYIEYTTADIQYLANKLGIPIQPSDKKPDIWRRIKSALNM